jgi:hypothetical protein
MGCTHEPVSPSPIKSVTASSTLPSKKQPGYAADNLFDDTDSTMYADMALWLSPGSVPYHFVGVRKIVDGQVVTVEIARYKAHPASPEGPALLGIVDIQGNGTLDIVVQQRGDHSWSASLHRIEGAEAKDLANPWAYPRPSSETPRE